MKQIETVALYVAGDPNVTLGKMKELVEMLDFPSLFSEHHEAEGQWAERR